MDIQSACFLVESLLQRFERDPKTGKFQLGGAISDLEWGALQALLVHSGHIPHGFERTQTEAEMSGIPSASPNQELVQLDLSSLEVEVDETVLLCLDFGTALSKAFATWGGDTDLVDLELGRIAGEPNAIWPVNSTLYISKDRIWFGPEAIRQSNAEQDTSRSRFDSPKQWISRGDFEAIYDRRVDRPRINPSFVDFTVADLILLYLSYLTDLTGTALEEKGKTRYALRRFARPSWKADQDSWATPAMAKMLALAQIVSDTLHGQWSGGLSVKRARSVLDAAGRQTQLPQHLIKEPVLEASAAANGALRTGGSGRRLCLVVDVGAGTSDFGLFLVVTRADGGVTIAEIPGSSEVLRQAGDSLDDLLVDHILRKSGLRSETDHGDQVASHLVRRKRDLKEALFRDGFIEDTLSNDDHVRVDLREFLAEDRVVKFGGLLEETFTKSLLGVDPSWFSKSDGKIFVVLTGGGANIPLVTKLGEGSVTIHGHKLSRELFHLTPEWVNTRYPSLAPLFPQLAVAIGGAADNLPRMARSSDEFGGDAPDGPRFILPTYKGS